MSVAIDAAKYLAQDSEMLQIPGWHSQSEAASTTAPRSRQRRMLIQAEAALRTWWRG